MKKIFLKTLSLLMVVVLASGVNVYAKEPAGASDAEKAVSIYENLKNQYEQMKSGKLSTGYSHDKINALRQERIVNIKEEKDKKNFQDSGENIKASELYKKAQKMTRTFVNAYEANCDKDGSIIPWRLFDKGYTKEELTAYVKVLDKLSKTDYEKLCKEFYKKEGEEPYVFMMYYPIEAYNLLSILNRGDESKGLFIEDDLDWNIGANFEDVANDSDVAKKISKQVGTNEIIHIFKIGLYDTETGKNVKIPQNEKMYFLMDLDNDMKAYKSWRVASYNGSKVDLTRGEYFQSEIPFIESEHLSYYPYIVVLGHKYSGNVSPKVKKINEKLDKLIDSEIDLLFNPFYMEYYEKAFNGTVTDEDTLKFYNRMEKDITALKDKSKALAKEFDSLTALEKDEIEDDKYIIFLCLDGNCEMYDETLKSIKSEKYKLIQKMNKEKSKKQEPKKHNNSKNDTVKKTSVKNEKKLNSKNPKTGDSYGEMAILSAILLAGVSVLGVKRKIRNKK